MAPESPSSRTRWTAVLLLCGLALVAFYLYVWSGNQRRIRRLVAEIGTLRAEIEQTRAVAAQLPQLQEELATLQQRLAVLMRILPEARETDELLRRVQAAASDSNLSIRRATFLDPIPRDFYAEFPVELELTGTYHDLARFFDRVSKFARIINVDQVVVRAYQGSAGETVQAACTAKTFFFLEEPAAPAEGAAAAR